MKSIKRVMWGLILIGLGVLVVMDKMAIISVPFYLLACLVVLGCVITAIIDRSIFFLTVSLSGLIYIYGRFTNSYDIPIWILIITSGIISIGIRMIFPKKFKFNFHSIPFGHHKYEQVIDATGGNSYETDNSSDVVLDSSFASVVKYVNSEDFKTAKANVSFGEGSLYFNNAVVKEGNADLSIDVSFGQLNLFIPNNWQVNSRVRTSFSEIYVQPTNVDTTVTLTINGDVSFSGVKITRIN